MARMGKTSKPNSPLIYILKEFDKLYPLQLRRIMIISISIVSEHSVKQNNPHLGLTGLSRYL